MCIRDRGYALRRLIAERAHSAREGVEIAAALVEMCIRDRSGAV